MGHRCGGRNDMGGLIGLTAHDMELQEGLRAVVEKRKPVWKNK